MDVSGGHQFRLIETDPDNGYATSKTYPVRTGSGTFVGVCDSRQHLYVELHPTADGEANVSAKAQYWHR